MKQLVAILILCVVYTSAIAQWQVGVFGAGAYNLHNGTFSTYEGILECGKFDKAQTLGWQAGNYCNYAFTPELGISTRLYYHKANGTFVTPNPIQPRIRLDDGSLVPLATEQELETFLDYVSIDLLGTYHFSPSLYVALGPTIGVNARAAYAQTERILSPSGATFLSDGSTARRISAGSFSSSSGDELLGNLRFAATIGVGYEYMLSKQLTLNPEIGFSYAFTNVLSTNDWKVNTVRAGVGLLYTFLPPPEPIIIREEPTKPEKEVAPVVPAPPVAWLDARNVNEQGKEESFAELVVDEKRTSTIMPLLPYVFFDKKSAELPDRYKVKTQGFSEASLPDDALEIYHDVLNIVGSRMNNYSDATLTIIGCVDPRDDANAKGVSLSRAIAVKNYLQQQWGIADARIAVKQSSLPRIPSTQQSKDGREENRRAELVCSDARVLAPVVLRGRTTTVLTKDVNIKPGFFYNGDVSSYSVTVKDEQGKELWKDVNKGKPAESIAWNVASTPFDNPFTSNVVKADFTLSVAGGTDAVAIRAIPVRRSISSTRMNGEVIHDTLVERFSLVMFDFDKPTLRGLNETISEMIRSRMRTTSLVSIEGMTDRIGKAKNNKILSQARANSVLQNITERIKPESISAKGLGEVDKHSNDLPEGRFYNRMVTVEIATPVAENELESLFGASNE